MPLNLIHSFHIFQPLLAWKILGFSYCSHQFLWRWFYERKIQSYFWARGLNEYKLTKLTEIENSIIKSMWCSLLTVCQIINKNNFIDFSTTRTHKFLPRLFKSSFEKNISFLCQALPFIKKIINFAWKYQSAATNFGIKKQLYLSLKRSKINNCMWE